MSRIKSLFVLALLLLVVGTVTATPAHAQSLTSSCQYCTAGDTVTYTGSGFHASKGNPAPTMRVWVDDVDPTTCVLTGGSNFSCQVTYTVEPGVYNIVVYDKSDLNAHGITVLGATNCILQAPSAARKYTSPSPAKPSASKVKVVNKK